jgi:hypothetical protein
MRGVAREGWEAAGYEVRVVAPSGIAPKIWKADPASHHAPSPVWNKVGGNAATCFPLAIFW